MTRLVARLAGALSGRASRDRLPREAGDEALEGWRAWQVVECKDGPALASWWMGTLWPTRRAMTSGCHAHGSRPAAHHVCGLHAFASHDDALAYAVAGQEQERLFALAPARALGVAVGRVSGWGRVVGHTHGWRSQFAYPFDLYLLAGDRSVARLIADRYAVETIPGLPGP